MNPQLWDAVEDQLRQPVVTPRKVLKPRQEPGVPNREFARTNLPFQDACARAGVQPTSRQASKFRRKFGSAYLARRTEGQP